MTSHSNFGGDDGDGAAVVGTVATAGDSVGNDKVPSALPTDMFLWIPAFAGMTSHSNFCATDNNRAVVVGTAATDTGGVFLV